MSKSLLFLGSLLLLLVTISLTSCDSGSSSGGGSGVSCARIDGRREGLIKIYPEGIIEEITVNISRDCNFKSASKSTGLSEGVITHLENSVYSGTGYSQEGCGGPFTITINEERLDEYFFILTCQ